MLRTGKYCQRVGAGAPVYMASALEYLCAEILEMAGRITGNSGKVIIMPRHVQLAIGGDEEFSKLFNTWTISGGGVTPYINPIHLIKNKPKKRVTASQAV